MGMPLWAKRAKQLTMADIEWFRQLLRGSLDSEEQDPTPLLKWLEEKRSVAKFSARLIDISEIRAWSAEEKTGNIHHESRAFFSIQGVRVTSIGLREVNEWDQPIFATGGKLGRFRRGFWSLYTAVFFDETQNETNKWILAPQPQIFNTRRMAPARAAQPLL